MRENCTGACKNARRKFFPFSSKNSVIRRAASDIYAWSIDFFRLEKGDRFKIVYTQKYVDDSIYVGLNRIHAAYFEHRKKP